LHRLWVVEHHSATGWTCLLSSSPGRHPCLEAFGTKDVAATVDEYWAMFLLMGSQQIGQVSAGSEAMKSSAELKAGILGVFEMLGKGVVGVSRFLYTLTLTGERQSETSSTPWHLRDSASLYRVLSHHSETEPCQILRLVDRDSVANTLRLVAHHLASVTIHDLRVA
jgi:hypothetical protein